VSRTAVVAGLSLTLLAVCLPQSEACFRRRCGCMPVYQAPYCQPAYPSPYYAPYYPPLYSFGPSPDRRGFVELTAYRSPRGRLHRVFDTRQGETTEHDRPEPSLTGAGAGPDLFLGKARKAAKTSISDGPVTTFAGLAALLDALPDDDTMRAMNLKNKPRVAEEEKNVTVSAYLYALKKEADNDFHIILGSDPDSSVSRFMTAEVSGLPEAGPFKAPLKAVRDKFKSNPATSQVNTSSYIVFDPPIPVAVKGSLFYDVDHQPGEIGPSGYRPQTSWEIHPVTDIDFDQ
jgi:hypothetical protein